MFRQTEGEEMTLMQPVDWRARSDEWQEKYWVLHAFARKVADYSNDGWLAREAAALVGCEPGCAECSKTALGCERCERRPAWDS